MGWTSYQADYYKNGKIDRKAEVLELCKKCTNSNLLKLVSKGTKYYGLFESKKTKQMWACLFLTYTEDNCIFGYKDIELNPFEIGGVPDSILNAFIPSTENDKKWLEENLAYNKEQNRKNSVKYKIGDVLRCKATSDIEWNGGYKLAKNEEFFVSVAKLNPFKKKSKQIFVITEYNKTFDGHYEYVRRPRRLGKSYFEILETIKEA